MSLLFPRINRIRNEELGSIYEFLASKRILCLYGPIVGMAHRSDNFSSAYVIDALLTLDMLNNDPIWLIINSPGGVVEEGMMLVDTIHLLRSPVYTIGRSVQSIAATIMAVGAKDHRYLFPHSRTMLHLPSTDRLSGDSSDVAIYAKQLSLAKDIMIDVLISSGVTKSRKRILADIDRDFWMSANEAIEYGLADCIIQPGTLPYDYPQSLFNTEIMGNPIQIN